MSTFSNQDLIELLQAYGVATKIERGNRVFPVSDDANQVAEGLLRFAKDQGVTFRLNSEVTQICFEGKNIIGVQSTTGYYPANKVIITTEALAILKPIHRCRI